jgi:hypothetical protein
LGNEDPSSPRLIVDPRNHPGLGEGGHRVRSDGGFLTKVRAQSHVREDRCISTICMDVMGFEGHDRARKSIRFSEVHSRVHPRQCYQAGSGESVVRAGAVRNLRVWHGDAFVVKDTEECSPELFVSGISESLSTGVVPHVPWALTQRPDVAISGDVRDVAVRSSAFGRDWAMGKDAYFSSIQVPIGFGCH